MAVILAQVILANDNGLAEDAYVNTFHFNGAATGSLADDIADALVDFYNTNSGTDAVRSYLSQQISQVANACSIKFYDVTAGPGGTPYHTVPWTCGSGDATPPLPSEVACCLSYKATPLAGANEARRRGRIYVGPLNGLAREGAQIARPAANLITTLLQSANVLHDAVSTAGAPWVIYSRVADTTALVDQAWVDNAFDTQRRRGAAPTTRTTVVL